MCLPNTASRSNHTTTCVHISPWCAWKVKKCIIVICARHRTLCTGCSCPFFSCPPICVCIILHIYIYAHTRMKTLNTHKGTVSLYAYKHIDQKTRTRTQERENKRDREDVLGGRSLEIGSGWWSGLHLQVLEACLPRSLHTCLNTSNNGMFQGHSKGKRSRRQPTKRAHAYARRQSEIYLPRTH